MASSAIRYLLHLLHTFWSFWARVLYHTPQPHASSTEVPTSSPTVGHEELISGRPNALPNQSSSFPAPVPAPACTWNEDKQQFLHKPSLVRVELFRKAHAAGVEKRRTKQAHQAISAPRIYIQDWNSPEIRMSELFGTTSHKSSTSRPSLPALATPALPSPTLSNASSPSMSMPTTPNHFSLDPILEDSIEIEAEGINTGNPLAYDLETGLSSVNTLEHSFNSPSQAQHNPTKRVRFDFNTPCYSYNPLSAVSGFLWDAPTKANPQSTLLPRFTSTPATTRSSPKSCSNPPEICGPNLVPYPDVFDLAMYDRPSSRDSEIVILPLSTKHYEDPNGRTPRPLTINEEASRDRDRYRNSAYSRLSGTSSPNSSFGKPKSASKDVTPPLRIVKRVVTDPDARPTAEPTRAISPLSPRSEDSSFTSEYNSVGRTSRDVAPRESIDTQLQAACGNLSRCAWTEEEFLRIFAS